MNKPKKCIYDNPNTMCREAYIDGRIVAYIDARWLIGEEGQWQHNTLLFMGVQKEWNAGNIDGDPDALMGSGVTRGV